MFTCRTEKQKYSSGVANLKAYRGQAGHLNSTVSGGAVVNQRAHTDFGAVTAGWPCRHTGPVFPEPPENLFVFMKSNIEILAAG